MLPHAIIIAALFLPKLNIISLGEATFIRLDDVLIGLYVLVYGRYFKRPVLTMKTVDRWILVFYAFVGVSLLSAIYNSAKGNVGLASALMFALRHFEYAAYLLVGMHAYCLRVDHYKLFSALAVFLAILIPLQFMGIVGAQSDFDAVGRAIGNTAGPFELAIVAAFLCLYFWEQKNKPYRVVFLLLSLGILLATKSRITTVATLLIGGPGVLRYTGAQLRQRPLALIGILLVALPLGLSVVFGTGTALDRFQSISQMDSATLTDWVTQVPVVQGRDDYLFLAYDELLGSVRDVEGDTSALIRFYRWSLLINYVLASVPSLLIGVGPSFASVAVDGYYVRIFTETGIIGLVLYICFLWSVSRRAELRSTTRRLVFIMAITGCFIDIFVSSKAMFVFWFWLGYSTLGPVYFTQCEAEPESAVPGRLDQV